MLDAINTLMLVCASLASMAFGVLMAYGICRVGFAILRTHVQSVRNESAAAIARQTEPQIARLT